MSFLRFFNPKLIICLFAIVGVVWFSPDFLYSEPEISLLDSSASPSATGAASPSTSPTTTIITPPTPTPRSTTSIQPTSKPQVQQSLGQQALEPGFKTYQAPSLITQAVMLSIMALFPFIIMILTSFLKIVIVLSLLRTALGVQQAPPNQIINGVAFMLSLFIMYPTVLKMYDASSAMINSGQIPDSFTSPESSAYIVAIASVAGEPLREFLKKNSSVKHQALFFRMAYRMLPEEHRGSLTPSDFMILVPSFITSQLKDAFEIGVLIYIPFFVIDLVTSNILLAMGMMMLSPVTISMPLKLFLLVMLDGWTLLIEGLVNTFR
jgi:type III secretion protein R